MPDGNESHPTENVAHAAKHNVNTMSDGTVPGPNHFKDCATSVNQPSCRRDQRARLTGVGIWRAALQLDGQRGKEDDLNGGARRVPEWAGDTARAKCQSLR